MRICGFYTKSITSYDDDQISIPIESNACINIARLVDHASVGTFYSAEEFASLYRALGHEYGIGHASSTETILALNLFDLKFAIRMNEMLSSDDSPETCDALEDQWARIRHQFLAAEYEASIKRTSRENERILPCVPVKPFEFPKPL